MLTWNQQTALWCSCSYQWVWRHPIWICWFWMHTDAHPSWQGVMILLNTFTFKWWGFILFNVEGTNWQIIILTSSKHSVQTYSILSIVMLCFQHIFWACIPFKVILENILDITFWIVAIIINIHLHKPRTLLQKSHQKSKSEI